MQTKRINPWPTPELELQRLATTLGSLTCGRLYWDQLSFGQRERLGGEFVTAFQRFGGTVGLYRKLTGMPSRRAILEVALRIDLLGTRDHARLAVRLNEDDSTLEARVRYAVQIHSLVLIPEQRAFYFDGIRVDLSARSQEWKLIELLAKKAPSRRLVAPEEIGGEELAKDYLSKMLSRMANRRGFPLGLRDLIESPNKDGRWTLKLDADQICVISSED